MPVIHLEFDDKIVPDTDAESLSKAVRDIVSEATSIEDVFVYGNSARIKVQIAPIEIFVYMSGWKIKDIDALLSVIKEKISAWKSENKFPHPINLTLAPMDWKIEIGI